ncbi:hypothetical protein [Nonomuraea sp. NPDC002799]
MSRVTAAATYNATRNRRVARSCSGGGPASGRRDHDADGQCGKVDGCDKEGGNA